MKGADEVEVWLHNMFERKRKTSDVEENLEKYNKGLRFFYPDVHIQYTYIYIFTQER